MEPRSKSVYQFGPFLLDPEAHVLLRDGRPVGLPPKAFDLLLALVRDGGRLLAKDELLSSVWPDVHVEENNLNQYVSMLRKTLGEDGNGNRYIETVPRLGFRFVASVQELVGEAAKRKSGSTSWLARWRVMAAGAAVLLVLAVIYVASARQRVPVVVDTQRLGRIEGFWYEMFVGESNIYFQGRRSVAYLPVTGGEPATLASPLDTPFLLDLSHVRPEFLAISGVATGDVPLWIVPVPTGSPQRIGNLQGHDAGWSPDAKRIVFAAEHNLYLANRDGTGLRRLCSDVGWALHLRWSPDGRVIRYIANDEKSGTASLWEISAEGSSPVRLLLGGNATRGMDDFAGEWSRDGRYFFYGYTRDDRSDIWALHETRPWYATLGGAAGQRHTEVLQITKGPVGLHTPVPTADGKKILAVAMIERAELVRYDAASRSYQPFMGGISADGLTFSRDGDWVAYTTFPERALWRSKADGSARQQLTFAPTEALLPCWSPDASRIAFMSRVPGKTWKIYLLAAGGGTPEAITNEDEDEANPTWSPDGERLAYAGAPWVKGWTPASTAIQVLDLRTSKRQVLPNSQGLWSPRWSPDGRWLVAETTDSKRLLLYSFESANWSQLADAGTANLGYSGWSHDSRYIYFNVVAPDHNPIRRTPLKGGRTELVLAPDGIRSKDTLGTWFALTPDDQPLLLRDTSVQEIYALDWQLP